MKNNIIYILLCIMPTFALGYNDKYDGSASGIGFILYVAIVGGIMLINWIRARFGSGKD
jgi:hypothetical protein